MQSALAIGDFARATHMSVKALRHYHRIGLLEPAGVDAGTGYRRYTTEQIPVAQVIRRFRDLDMPLNEIKAVLATSDASERGELVAAHLARLEAGLARTQSAVASLRNLLEQPAPAEPADVGHRRIDAVPAAAITEVVDIEDALAWHHGALGELYAILGAQDVLSAGPAGGIFANELFAHERGQATIFVPSAGAVRPMGRVVSLVVPAAELATTVHAGPHTDIDRAYGSLATYVTHHALAVDGPIREYYLVGPHDTPDQARWRTEVGWPIFQTGAA
jgi:DNA-binding transcriptional MerR regulator/effector-binding domain-containing protein